MGSKKPLWNDPEVYKVARLRPHSAGFPAGSVENARDGRADASVKLLNGSDWKFYFAKNIRGVPARFTDSEFNDAAFRRVNVPGNWQLYGCDKPIYSNYKYPRALRTDKFTVDAALNTVGCYRLNFDYSPAGERCRTVLRFDGISSCAYIYLNGKFVGYTQNSFGRAEFDVSGSVLAGANVLALKVMRYCDGSFLEDQDMWRMSGIFRDVCIYEQPRERIADIFADSRFNKTFEDATLNVRADVASDTGVLKQGGKLRVTLYDADGAEVDTAADEFAPFTSARAKSGMAFKLKAPHKWSFDDPYLYRIVLELYDKNDTLCDARGFDFGFRSVCVVRRSSKYKLGPFLLFNGVPIKIRGVNRHEFDPENGFAVTREFNERDVKIIKQNNFNAVRTSHYPPSEAMLELCDRYGLLVMCENNLETHGAARRIPGDKPVWAKQCLDRLSVMINCYKNHPSVFMWSLGNESGKGKAFFKMAQLCKKIDPTRPVHYECDLDCSDVMSGMYQPASVLADIAGQKAVTVGRNIYNPFGDRYSFKEYYQFPFLLCEYAHAMGNSLGDIAQYWQLINENDRLIGGFIWDYADLGLMCKGVLCYGGDFGDEPNDGNFCFDGLVRGDRQLNPAMHEARNAMAPVRFALEGDTLTVRSYTELAPLSGCEIHYRLYGDGREVDSGVISDVEVKAGGSESVKLDLSAVRDCARADFSAELVRSAASAFAPASAVIYSYTKQLKFAPRPVSAAKAAITLGDREITLAFGGGKSVVIDRANAALTALRVNGKNLLKTPLRLNMWRAPIDNDLCLLLPKPLRRTRGIYKMKRAGERIRVVDVATYDSGVLLRCSAPGMSELAVQYSAMSDGKLCLRSWYRAGSSMPKCGFTLGLDPSFDNITYYGMGPFENYPDRLDVAQTGVYSTTAAGMANRYSKPQDNGNRCGVHSFKISGPQGRLEFEYIKTSFNVSVYPFATAQLEEKAHDAELESNNTVTVNIDGHVRGVGGDRPGMPSLLPEYDLKADRRYFTLVALDFSDEGDAARKEPAVAPGVSGEKKKETPPAKKPQPAEPKKSDDAAAKKPADKNADAAPKKPTAKKPAAKSGETGKKSGDAAPKKPSAKKPAAKSGETGKKSGDAAPKKPSAKKPAAKSGETGKKSADTAKEKKTDTPSADSGDANSAKKED